jgi:hypothetical protein
MRARSDGRVLDSQGSRATPDRWFLSAWSAAHRPVDSAARQPRAARRRHVIAKSSLRPPGNRPRRDRNTAAMIAPEHSSNGAPPLSPAACATAGELTFAIGALLSQPDMPANARGGYATTLRFIETRDRRADAERAAAGSRRDAAVGPSLAGDLEPEDRDGRIVSRLFARSGPARRPWRTAAGCGGVASTTTTPAQSQSEPRPSLTAPRDSHARAHALTHALRDRCARANEVLGIDIQDRDIPNKRARGGSEGGDTDYAFCQAGNCAPTSATARRPQARTAIPVAPRAKPWRAFLRRWTSVPSQAAHACPRRAEDLLWSTPAGHRIVRGP